MAEVISGTWKWSIPLSNCIPIPELAQIYSVVGSRKGQIPMYKHPFSSLLSVLLGTRPGVELLDHVVVLGLNF